MESAGLARVRRRGSWVTGTLALVSVIGFPVSFFVTPPLVSAVLMAIVIATFSYVIAECLMPAAKCSAKPRAGRFLCVLAVVVALLGAFFSLVFAGLVSMPDVCVFPVPSDEPPPRICQVTTPAQDAGFNAWCWTIAVTAILLIACAIFARRSWIACWAAIPVVIAGCVIAIDLAHAAALAKGKNPYNLFPDPAPRAEVTAPTGSP
jgi:hypothetical protein